jgi:hypothetical protein
MGLVLNSHKNMSHVVTSDSVRYQIKDTFGLCLSPTGGRSAVDHMFARKKKPSLCLLVIYPLTFLFYSELISFSQIGFAGLHNSGNFLNSFNFV